MNKTLHSPRILLLQFRQDNVISIEEAKSFIQYSKIHPEQLETLNVFTTPEFEPNIIEQYDAMFIGGASGISVTQTPHPHFINNSLALIQHCINIDKPVFASCYGFQLTVIALNGSIIRDENNFEKGTPLIYLSENAKQDPLFCHTPSPFPAISVHHDKTTSLPNGCELMAFNDNCIHAFRIINKPFWAVQFHPEINLSTFTHRLNHYKSIYTKNEQEYQALLNSCVETPESHALLSQFISLIKP